MARISISDLYVVQFPHTDGYSFDTGTPDDVYTSREEAQAFADELNESPKPTFARCDKSYYVECLYDRFQTVKDECRREGERNAAIG